MIHFHNLTTVLCYSESRDNTSWFFFLKALQTLLKAQQCNGNILSLSIRWGGGSVFPIGVTDYSYTFPPPVTECSLLFYWKMFLVTPVGVLKVHNCCLNTFHLLNLSYIRWGLSLKLSVITCLIGQEKLYRLFSQPENLGYRFLHPYLLKICPNKFNSGILPSRGKLYYPILKVLVRF